jgi:hypothetical protein
MKTLKTIKFLAIAMLFLGLNSCSDDSQDDESGTLDVKRIENFQAPADIMDYSGAYPVVIQEMPFHYFSFAQGIEVAVTDSWDIAFKGSKIKVNGGVSGDGQVEVTVITGIFNDVTEVLDTIEFNVDTAISDTAIDYAVPYGSGLGWYTFSMDTHLYSPIPGRVILIKTNDGKYAKMEILSYYKDQTTEPTIQDGGYYTFNYVYQPDGSKFF